MMTGVCFRPKADTRIAGVGGSSPPMATKNLVLIQFNEQPLCHHGLIKNQIPIVINPMPAM